MSIIFLWFLFFWQPPSGTVIIVLRRFFSDGFMWTIMTKTHELKASHGETIEVFFTVFFFFNTTRHIPHIPLSLHFLPFRSALQGARQVVLTVFLLNRYVLSSGKYHIYSCGLTVFPSLFYVQESSPCWCDMEKPKLLVATRYCSFKGLTWQ